MNAYRYPTVFLSHGTPMHAFGEDAYQNSISNFSASFPKPKAIVFVTSHAVSSEHVLILKTEKNSIRHDFSGFPKELYDIQYSCPGDMELADKIEERFKVAGFKTLMEYTVPLDHAVWIPLMHLYPKGDVPVTRVSLPVNLEPAQILKMGHTLASLREQGYLIVSSGGAVHNMREIKWAEKQGAGHEYARHFEEFIVLALQNKDVEAILHSDELPFFKSSHPTLESFNPLVFAVGATLVGDNVNIIFRGIEYGSLSMLCFSLNHAQTQPLH